MLKIAVIPALMFSGYILSCHKDEGQSKKPDAYSSLSGENVSALVGLRDINNLGELSEAEQGKAIHLLRDAWTTVFCTALAQKFVDDPGPNLARVMELFRREKAANADNDIFKELVQKIGLKNFVQCFLYFDWLLKSESYFTDEAEAEEKFSPEVEAQLIQAIRDRFNVDMKNDAEFTKLEKAALQAMLEMQQGLQMEFKAKPIICCVS